METMTKTARLPIPGYNESPDESKPVLEAVEKQLGMVPNVIKVLSLSPTALQSFLMLQHNLSRVLDLKTRTAISLSVSEVNGCLYCLSAHTHFAKVNANTKDEEIGLNRRGESFDAKVAAAAKFAAKVVRTRGMVEDEDLNEIHAAGYSDAEIVEMIALATQFTLTNFLNNVARTDIDFAVAPAIEL